MLRRFAAAFVLIAAASVPAFTQSAPPPVVPPMRAPDGHPNFEGIWTNATITPLQRPAALAGTPTLDEAGAARYAKEFLDENNIDRRPDDPQQDVNLAYQNFFLDRGTELALVDGTRRTSLIVDPPDGRIPPRTATADARGGRGFTADAAENAAGRGSYDNVEERPLSERCLLSFGSSSGPPMLPVLYNNHYQFVQTGDYLMILVEMDHDARIIRMNTPHFPASIRRWMGDSVGHWDGDTLVVDTTNFTAKTRFQGSTENLHVVERFTRVDPSTILYRVTMDDPATWTRPWTAEIPFRLTAEPIYEYACHEGNYALGDIMRGARLLEREAAKPESSR
jgi:hypothetical protein